MSNHKQGLDRMHHCAKQQDSMWFSSGMRAQKPVCQTTEQTN